MRDLRGGMLSNSGLAGTAKAPVVVESMLHEAHPPLTPHPSSQSGGLGVLAIVSDFGPSARLVTS